MYFMFQSMPEIKAAYIVHDLNSYDWVPGSSDIDIAVVVEDMLENRELIFLKRFWRKFRYMKNIFPFVSYGIGSIPICSISEFGTDGFGGTAEAWGMHKLSDWKLFYGIDTRNSFYIPRNRQYKTTLSNPLLFKTIWKHYLTPLIRNNKQFTTYLRKPSNGIKMIIKHIYIKECDSFYKSETQLFDYFYRKRDHAITQILDLIKRLEKSRYFVRNSNDAESIMTAFFYGAIRVTDRYCSDYLLNAKHATELKSISAVPINKMIFRRSDMDAALNILPKKNAYIKNIIHSPQTNQFPFELNNVKIGTDEIYIIIDESISLEDFKDFIRNLREKVSNNDSFSRCNIFIETKNTLLAKEHSIGSHFALHHFHLKKYGSCSHGTNILQELRMPSLEKVREAIKRQLWVEYYRNIKSYPADFVIGKSHIMLQDRVHRLLSYRLFLEKESSITSFDEVSESYIANFSEDSLTKEIERICKIKPDFKITTDLCDKYYFIIRSLLNKMSCP